MHNLLVRTLIDRTGIRPCYRPPVSNGSLKVVLVSRRLVVAQIPAEDLFRSILQKG